MNEYKITYTIDGETYSTNRVDHTEANARRSFLKDYKEMGTIAEIINIEFIRDDAIATKKQERDALAAIKKIVEELGPQSYIATAFEGCFDDAESNIENDFGDSMKQRADEAREEAEHFKIAAEEAEKARKKAELNERDLRAALGKAKIEASETITALQQQVLGSDDFSDISKLLSDKVFDLDTEVKNAAQRIVESADQPDSAFFQNAVKDHRVAQADLSYYTAFLVKVNDIKNEA